MLKLEILALELFVKTKGLLERIISWLIKKYRKYKNKSRNRNKSKWIWILLIEHHLCQ